MGLATGDYTVSVNYVGFKVFTKNVRLAAGQAARVDATLEVAALNSSPGDGGAAERRSGANQPAAYGG